MRRGQQLEIVGAEAPRIQELDDALLDWLEAKEGLEQAKEAKAMAQEVAIAAFEKHASQMPADPTGRRVYKVQRGGRTIRITVDTIERQRIDARVIGKEKKDGDSDGTGRTP